MPSALGTGVYCLTYFSKSVSFFGTGGRNEIAHSYLNTTASMMKSSCPIPRKLSHTALIAGNSARRKHSAHMWGARSGSASLSMIRARAAAGTHLANFGLCFEFTARPVGGPAGTGDAEAGQENPLVGWPAYPRHNHAAAGRKGATRPGGFAGRGRTCHAPNARAGRFSATDVLAVPPACSA